VIKFRHLLGFGYARMLLGTPVQGRRPGCRVGGRSEKPGSARIECEIMGVRVASDNADFVHCMTVIRVDDSSWLLVGGWLASLFDVA
jgi:hypothetical protein